MARISVSTDRTEMRVVPAESNINAKSVWMQLIFAFIDYVSSWNYQYILTFITMDVGGGLYVLWRGYIP